MIFRSLYEQYAERNGQKCKVIEPVPVDEYDADECGAMYIVEFADGARIWAWPEELHEGD